MPATARTHPTSGDALLCITLSNIGDALMTTPVLEAMHRAYPQARIDIVADQRSSRLFDRCPYRGAIIHKHKREGWAGLWRLIRRLRRTRYELVVDLRTDGVAWLLRARRRLTKWRIRPPGPHAVERSWAVVAPIADRAAPPPTTVWLNDDDRARAADRLSALPGKRWLAVAPGANWPPKIWPLAYYRELIGLLAEEFDGVLIVGGPREVELTAALARDLPLPGVDLAGDPDLLQAAAALQRAAVFVGNDSGLGHLAAAVGTPTMTVFGRGVPERYHPWGPLADYLLAPQRDLNLLPATAVAERLRAHLARVGSA